MHHSLRQAQTEEILMVSRPRVSDVVTMKAGKFTIDTLAALPTRHRAFKQ
jgi:predicted XRE-type DNA-binding protein